MRTIDKREKITRRGFLAASGSVAVGAALVTTGTAVIAPDQGWGLEMKALKPQTMATLIQMARDIYPHDRLADRYYAVAVKGHDDSAASDDAHKQMIEEGVLDLDKRAGDAGYLGLGWEEDRVKVLHEIEGTPFFQTIRGGLVVSLYNQKEIWPLFGYEGASADEGGYLERGFDDIDWL